jgi:hypothetical protein
MRQTFSILLLGLSTLLNAQTAEIDSIQINGNIPFSLSLDELRRSDLNIDSITPVPVWMDMSTADSLVYIGRTYFEYDTTSNNCSLQLIHFDDKISTLTIGAVTLTARTTIEQMSKYFSPYCQITRSIKYYQRPDINGSCNVPLSANGRYIDYSLHFLFSDGLLKLIEIWEPS